MKNAVNHMDILDDYTASIDRAIVVMAYIVTRHGAQYLPILQRLEREKLACESTNEALERAKIIAKEYSGGLRNGTTSSK